MTTFILMFLIITGFIIGLGAVTVIDIHGFMGRKSEYWTEATTRTHKITKPMIWLGIILFTIGFGFLYEGEILFVQILLTVVMILNGLFLSFSVSPFLLKKEKEGLSHEILPKTWQTKITLSFIVSFICWWTSVGIFTYYLLSFI